jgi:hypothetical protein
VERWHRDAKISSDTARGALHHTRGAGHGHGARDRRAMGLGLGLLEGDEIRVAGLADGEHRAARYARQDGSRVDR